MREILEQNEEKMLAPYAMKSSQSLGRRYDEPEHGYRTAFQRDRDRIIHSTAFRRMEYKTQVFVNYEGDHYRTRLTHTIEVTQIARTIARALGLNEDLAETVALAHDIGHTPFGHAGEEALHDLMKDAGGFEHNAQGLRVVELLERRYPQFTGLNLSYEVRESIIKHNTTYDRPTPNKDYHPEWHPLLEAQVVDIADIIAYNNHDLDDGIRAGLIKEIHLADISLWQKASREHKKTMDPLTQENFLRPQTVITLINMFVTDLIANTLKRLKEYNINSIEDVHNSQACLVCLSEGLEKERKQLEKFLYQNVYRNYKVARMAEKARRFMESLFNTYQKEPQQLPPRYQQMAKEDSQGYEIGLKRAIADYLAGMTDRYAQQEYEKLFQA
ncbi:MAG: deoxyguanosinetriphosphate triphosphohydrolase [Candidatus Brocadiia bacterium]